MAVELKYQEYMALSCLFYLFYPSLKIILFEAMIHHRMLPHRYTEHETQKCRRPK
jgi:hypothetical protein